MTNELVFILFEIDYRFHSAYNDVDMLKRFLVQESVDAAKIAWVGVFKMNESSDTVPMWRPYEFVDGFPHSG